MKRYVTVNDMNKIQGIKGQIVESKNGVVLVKTSDIYTVWMPESGLMITNTYYLQEAIESFQKYTQLK